jgi:hypothetical protein
VTGTYQHVGNIDGDGTTQIKSGSDLAANRIIQSALVMGGNGERLSLVTIAASDASGNPLGQEVIGDPEQRAPKNYRAAH